MLPLQARRDAAISAAVNHLRIAPGSAAYWRDEIRTEAELAAFERDFRVGTSNLALANLADIMFATSPAHAEAKPIVAPKWIHICPAGEHDADSDEVRVRGRDGREFAILDVERVLRSTELPMQIDWDHQSVFPFPFGSTRAAGWIDLVEFVDKSDELRPARGFWARIERWVPEGRADVEASRFRGISPVVRYEYRAANSKGITPPPALVGFVNVALTNMPNLQLTMLHSRSPAHHVSGPLAHHAALAPLTKDEQEIAHAMGMTDDELRAAKLRDAAERATRDGEPHAAALRQAVRDLHAATTKPTSVPSSTPVAGLSEDERKIAHAMGLSESELLALKESAQ
ncbi:MAG: phage protease [Polyangiales bacterium]